MKRLLLCTATALALVTSASAQAADALSEDRGEVCDSDNPADCKRPATSRGWFKPWQRIWQCNDIRVTETVSQPGIANYDLGGTIWGGSQFMLNFNRGELYFNGRPCLQLR